MKSQLFGGPHDGTTHDWDVKRILIPECANAWSLAPSFREHIYERAEPGRYEYKGANPWRHCKVGSLMDEAET